MPDQVWHVNVTFTEVWSVEVVLYSRLVRKASGGRACGPDCVVRSNMKARMAPRDTLSEQQVVQLRWIANRRRDGHGRRLGLHLYGAASRG
jgi:hypothetical protein